MGNSVVDYAITEVETWERISEFKIGDREGFEEGSRELVEKIREAVTKKKVKMQRWSSGEKKMVAGKVKQN